MVKEFLKKRSLKQRLRIIMLIPATAAFIVAIYVYISDRQDDYISKIESEAQSLALGMSSTLESSLLSSDQEGIKKILTTTLAKAKCHRLTVYDVDNNVFSTVGKQLEGETISQKIPIYTEAFSDPFENGGVDNNSSRTTEVIGYLEVKVGDISFVKKHGNEILLAFIILISVILISLILAEALGNDVVQNINRVIHLSEENFKSGEFNKPYISDDKSELGELFDNKERERKLVKEMLEKEVSLRRKGEEAYLAKTRMLQVISHELNTPLSSAYGMLQIANKRVKRYFEAEVQSTEIVPDNVKMELSQLAHYLTVGERSIEHLSRFFNDLLAISDEEIFASKYRSVDLKVVLSSITDKHELDARAKNLAFDVSVEISQSKIFIDDLRFTQIVNNLLSNAIKYTSVGGVSLKVATFKDRIEITVEDTGCGINQADKDKIFKLSERATPDSIQESGKGIGLYVVGKCIETLDGEISLESKVNDYSKFNVTLPLLQETEEPKAEVLLRRTGLKIHVIDDDRDNLYLFSEMLKLFNIEFKAFMSPFEAYEAVITDKPDLVLVDYQLYGMNGLEFIRKTKTFFQENNEDVPIFICCSASGKTLEKQLAETSVDGFIAKPFNVQEIMSLIMSFYTGKNFLSNHSFKD